MDYKEAGDMLGWMARHAKLSGTDARVLTVLACDSNYKTSEIAASYDSLAIALSTTKQSVMLAIKRLEKSGAIKKLTDPVGRAPATYRVRSVDDLRLLHESEEFNVEWREWSARRDALFYDFERALDEIGNGCDECTEEEACGLHQRERDNLMSSQTGREMRLWDSDNPTPQSRVKKIKLIEMDKL
jgi:DNA-binding Lrp family transcriptional regulator